MTDRSHNTTQLDTVVSRDPEIHSGDLIFANTRVPVDTLLDYLKADHSVEEFLQDFPTVRRPQVDAYLELTTDGIDQLRAMRHKG